MNLGTRLHVRFNEADIDDSPSYSEDLLDVYKQGQQDRQTDKRSALDDGTNWCSISDILEESDGWDELAESLTLHVVFEGLEYIFEKTAFSLASLMVEVVNMKDTSTVYLLKQDWIGSVTQSDAKLF